MLGLKISDKVHYQPEHCKDDFENGMVKEIVSNRIVRVVYNCNKDWKNFKKYTGALTSVIDLKMGWR